MRRVVITGMGIYSCIGKNLDEVKESLQEGKSGIVYDKDRENFGFRSCLTGMVEPLTLKKELHRVLERYLQSDREYVKSASDRNEN